MVKKEEVEDEDDGEEEEEGEGEGEGDEQQERAPTFPIVPTFVHTSMFYFVYF